MFLDVRMLVNNDEGLQDGILQALEQYNTEQHISVTPPGLDYEVKEINCEDEKKSNQMFRLSYLNTVKSEKIDTLTLVQSKPSNLIICVW